MEFKLSKPVSAYRCPYCGGKVVKALGEDEPGCVHLVQWTCRGRNCYQTFGPPWAERLWQESDPPTLLVGMELWSEAEDAKVAEQVLPVTQAMLSRKATSKDMWRWVAEACVAVPVGSIIIGVMLHELLKTAPIMTHLYI